MDGLVELARMAGASVSALADDGDAANGDLLRHCIRGLPNWRPWASYASRSGRIRNLNR